MDLHVNLRSRRDLAGQIYRELRAAILDGRLRRGERVPPTRELALRLEVSRNTVSTEVGSIYRKLGVSSRSAAVDRATAIGLLGA